MSSVAQFFEVLERVLKDVSLPLPQALFAFNVLAESEESILITYLLDGNKRSLTSFKGGLAASSISSSFSIETKIDEPDCSISASESHFLQFSSMDRSGMMLVMSGKVKMEGNRELLKGLLPCFKAVKEKMSALTPVRLPPPKFMLKHEWVRDVDVRLCVVCSKEFGIITRKHHCRMCGQVVCNECSMRRIEGERVCNSCCTKRYTPHVTIEQKKEEMGVPSLLQSMFVKQLDAHKAEKIPLTNPPPSSQENDWRMLGLTRKVAQLEDLLQGQAKTKNNFPVLWVGLLGLLIVLQPFIHSFSMQDFSHLSSYSVKSLFFSLFTIDLYIDYVKNWSFSWNTVLFLIITWVVYVFVFSRNFLLRRMIIYVVAIRVIGGYALIKTWCRVFRYSDERTDAMYERAHMTYAPLLYRTIVYLQGFWIKVGQYLSSRTDVVPEVWSRELKKLQDSVPFDSMEIVGKIVEEELGDSISNLFGTFNSIPLAAASIAQVHEAQLKDGRRVVVKIQHPYVSRLMPQDFVNLGRIMSWVKALDSKFDFKPVLDEWSKETLKELDFRHEHENMQRVIQNFKNAKMTDVLIPTPISNMITQRVLVMTFMEGFKVTDTEQLDKYGIDRMALLRKIVQAYGQQIYLDGFFNGDPHPGNIMVQVIGNQAYPVLLDFGLTKELPPNIRCAFGGLVASAVDMDYGLMLSSFEAMGLKLNREAPGKDMEAIRFAFRDTAPPKEMRKALQSYNEEKMKALKKAPKATRNPIDAWPGELLFFFRVTLLLRALCSTLHVRMPYMEILAPYAKMAMIEKYDTSMHAVSVIYPSVCLSSLETKMRNLLTKLYSEKAFVGLQVCVIKDGIPLIELSAGTLAKTDPRPVQASTLFNCFSVTKAVAAMCLHVLRDRGLLLYDNTVASYWPAFGQSGKAAITVRQVLSHQAGLQHAINSRVTVTQLQDWDAMLKCIEEATPAASSAYHYLSFGYIVGGLVQKISGRHIRDFLLEEIAKPLKIESECFLGLPVELHDRAASLCNGFGPDGEPPSSEMLEGMMETMKKKAELEGKKGDVEFDNQAQFSGGMSLLDPCVFNTASVRKSCIPAANGHFTARALAKFYDAMCQTHQKRFQLVSSLTIAEMMRTVDAHKWGLGVQVFGFGEGLAMRNSGFGHTGLGGSVAYCDLASNLAVAVCVNKLTLDQRATQAVVDLVHQELNVPRWKGGSAAELDSLLNS